MPAIFRPGILILALVLAGCGSLPVPAGPDEGLLLIPVEVRRAADLGLAREFWAEFSDGRTAEIPTDGSPYLAVVVRAPGTEIIRIRSRIRSDRSYIRGEEAGTPVSLGLAYRPGRVAVSSWQLVFGQIRKSEAESFSSVWPEPATDARAQAAFDAAAADPGYRAWVRSGD